jgi:pyrroline-5-carboxylate reductase
MAKLRIGVFGLGNMGRAIVLGMSARFPKAEFFLFTPTHIKAQEVSQLVKGSALVDIKDMPRDLDWYLLAFKPQNLVDFQFDFLANSKIISVLAGVSVAKLMNKFNIKKVARLMPNTPSSIGEGTNLLYLNEYLDDNEGSELNLLLEATGLIVPLDSEQDLDLTTAFSGSGPALIFELARIFESELNRMTEGRVPAKEIVLKTFLGSAKLMNADQNRNMSFEELQSQVTSKKGVTHEALEVLKDNKLQDLFSNAFEAAYKRTIELSK